MTKENMKTGYFGEYGGQYVAEGIKNALDEIAEAYEYYKTDAAFQEELTHYLKDYSGRETPLYYAESLTASLGGAKVYLKREDLNHLGAHKLNNVLGQVLLAKRMGKTRIIAETGAGQHGTATAAAAAKLNMACEIYMGAKDIERQKLNVFRMELLGAKVTSVTEGNQTLKEAVDQSFEDLAENLEDTFYVVGSALGPHPYPTIVRDFQTVISQETKSQLLEKEGRLPDAVIACVGGGSNAIGSFAHFIEHEEVRLIGVEAAGKGLEIDKNAAALSNGKKAIFHGMNSYFLTDTGEQLNNPYSISAGLDYPGVGPEHSYLKDQKRAEFYAVTDQEALEAFTFLSQKEGIIPALESSHAIAYAMKLVPEMKQEEIVVITLSGRGDKDVQQVAKVMEEI